jgi:hypothetical protein
MEFAVEFGGEPQDVTVTASGVADVAGLRALVQRMAEDEGYRAGLLLLYDFRDLDLSELSDHGLEQVMEAVMDRDWTSEPRAVAVIAGPKTIEMARLAVAHLGGSKSRRQLFTSHDEAVAWLATMRA